MINLTDDIFECLYFKIRKFEEAHPTLPLDHIEIVINPELYSFIRKNEKIIANNTPQGITDTIFGIEITDNEDIELFDIRAKKANKFNIKDGENERK